MFSKNLIATKQHDGTIVVYDNEVKEFTIVTIENALGNAWFVNTSTAEATFKAHQKYDDHITPKQCLVVKFNRKAWEIGDWRAIRSAITNFISKTFPDLAHSLTICEEFSFANHTITSWEVTRKGMPHWFLSYKTEDSPSVTVIVATKSGGAISEAQYLSRSRQYFEFNEDELDSFVFLKQVVEFLDTRNVSMHWDENQMQRVRTLIALEERKKAKLAEKGENLDE